jgi:hypothetical protein
VHLRFHRVLQITRIGEGAVRQKLDLRSRADLILGNDPLRAGFRQSCRSRDAQGGPGAPPALQQSAPCTPSGNGSASMVTPGTVMMPSTRFALTTSAATRPARSTAGDPPACSYARRIA